RAMLRTFVSLICILSPALPAAAASSTWVKSGGGAVRIVTSGLSDKEGLLRGAIEIRLEPGWKTYWRDPGEAGIPPRLHLSAASDASAAELLFPPPERIKIGRASGRERGEVSSAGVCFTIRDAANPGGRQQRSVAVK